MKLHISFNNFKLRHICVFSILKLMKSNKNLILIGMMGSGKSTIGRLLGQKLNLRFFDIDFLIEKKVNMKIAEIFEKKGEDKFRNLEKKITLKFLNKNNCIISLGGGAFINKIIKKKVNKKGYCYMVKMELSNIN